MLKRVIKCKDYAVLYFIFDVKVLNYCINYCNTEIPVVLTYDLYIQCQT